MKNNYITSKIDRLFMAILSLENKKEAQIFFRDLLTEEEIVEFAARFEVAELLGKKVSYSSIVKKTGMSSTTIARISKWLNFGCGGYKLAIQRLHHSHTNPSLEDS
ncbi:TrpR YerC/YecD [Candidatus Roizmanbacteria bacterium]|nr:TrpR YerC/YecD [Candidatus Roizmanbacteria bacterium]